uniref:Uncharacterized protein n=1 Tax=Moniliophthora roreri TaxID=221103 RepID=A0A0W0FFJ7_MONRR
MNPVPQYLKINPSNVDEVYSLALKRLSASTSPIASQASMPTASSPHTYKYTNIIIDLASDWHVLFSLIYILASLTTTSFEICSTGYNPDWCQCQDKLLPVMKSKLPAMTHLAICPVETQFLVATLHSFGDTLLHLAIHSTLDSDGSGFDQVTLPHLHSLAFHDTSFHVALL